MTPSRGRPEQLARMARSIRTTAVHPVEIIVWLDDDDPAMADNLAICNLFGMKWIVGPRDVIHSSRWDRCLPKANGNILLHLNDDLVFRTPGWDRMVKDFFDASPDKLWVVGGDDGYLHSATLAPHPIVHRRWLNTLGYFIPPYFDGEYGDTWVSDLAARVDRLKFLPFLCEHMHFSRVAKETCPQCGENISIASVEQGLFCNRCGTLFGKPQMDKTALDYVARNQAQNPAAIFLEREPERTRDAEKLRALLGTRY